MSFIRSSLGFTLLELLIVIAIIGIFVLSATGYLFSWQQNTQLSVASDEIISNLRRAQAKAAVSVQNSEWGINFLEQQYIVFKGSNFEVRDQNEDEVFDIASNIDISNNFSDTIYFNKYSGQPSVSGQINLIDQTGQQVIVFINNWGMIEKE